MSTGCEESSGGTGFMFVTMALWMGLFVTIMLSVLVSVQNELLGRLFLHADPENDNKPPKHAVAES